MGPGSFDLFITVERATLRPNGIASQPHVWTRDRWTGSDREADWPLPEKRDLADAAPYSTSGMFAASS